MGGCPCSAETCCQSHPDTAEKGGSFTPSQQRGCIRDAQSTGLGQVHYTPPDPGIIHATSFTAHNSNNFPFFGLYTQVMTTWGTKQLRCCFKPFAPCSQSLSDRQNLPPSHRCIILLAVMMWFGPHKYLRAPPHPLICSLKELVQIAAA